MRSPGEGGRKLPFRIVGPWPGTLLVQPSCSPSAPVSIWSLGIPWTTIFLDGSLGDFLLLDMPWSTISLIGSLGNRWRACFRK